jgi:hypothetical protein
MVFLVCIGTGLSPFRFPNTCEPEQNFGGGTALGFISIGPLGN